MAARLHQLLAAAKTAKSENYNRITNLRKLFLKPALFQGMTKDFQSTNDEYPEFRPQEIQKVQYTASDVLADVQKYMIRIMDQTATIDRTNQGANADVILDDGTVLLQRVPTVTLLFLEKQLADLHTIIKDIPTLDPAKNWNHTHDTDVWETAPVESISAKKVVRPLVLYPATEKHPAQVDKITEDVKIGSWTTKYQSGAMEGKRVQILLERVEDLQAAVKKAREHANTVELVETKIGKNVMDFVFRES